MINKLLIQTEIIKPDEMRKIDGITFTNAIIVNLTVGNSKVFHDSLFRDYLVVYSELLKSINETGKYLIVTSMSGIADEGGWYGVYVKHCDSYICWEFEFNREIHKYMFDKDDYINQVLELKYKLEKLESLYEIEPTQIFYPECW